MAKALTVKSIEQVKPGAARREIPDGILRGLYLVVQPVPSGKKSWAVRYRFGGKPSKLTIGAWPAIDLLAARGLASKALRAVAEGTDPSAEKKKAHRAAAAHDRDTIEDVINTFIARYAKANTRERSWQEAERILKRELLPRWKGRRVQDIAKRDIIELLDDISDRAPIMANRTLAHVRRMMNWCVERTILIASPCDGVRAPAGEVSRDRVLIDDEICLLWRACDDIEWPFGPLVKMLILTGQRRDEVAGMRWCEIDAEKRLWIIPRERVKTDVAHEVPLSNVAHELLRSLPKVKSNQGFVFTTTGETPVGGFSRAKIRLGSAIAEARREATVKADTDFNQFKPPAPWRLHDLRRTVASGMARLNVNLPVIEKVLNHTSGTFGGIAGVYQRHEFADEKRAALKAWAEFVISVVERKPAANVFAIWSPKVNA